MTDTRQPDIARLAEHYTPDMVRFLRDMIAIPSESAEERGVIDRARAELEALRFDEVRIDGSPVQPFGNWADLKSNEVVFTVPYKSNANRPGVMFDTRIRFTIGGTGSVEVPLGQPQSGPTRPGAPRPGQPPAAPPTTAPPTTAPTPQQRAEDARQRSERMQACVQQAMRENPTGGLALSQAIAACAQTK